MSWSERENGNFEMSYNVIFHMTRLQQACPLVLYMPEGIREWNAEALIELATFDGQKDSRTFHARVITLIRFLSIFLFNRWLEWWFIYPIHRSLFYFVRVKQGASGGRHRGHTCSHTRSMYIHIYVHKSDDPLDRVENETVKPQRYYLIDCSRNIFFYLLDYSCIQIPIALYLNFIFIS